jgi:uncharacterized protein YdeI (YjbR/CyaY-like superfamily)
MEIGETLYIVNRDEWREWLEKNHDKKNEIWLVYYSMASRKPFIPYADAVEEALCFGWIDSTIKKLEADSRVQRFSPRRKNSLLSELNRERVKKMIDQGKMTGAGLQSLRHHLEVQDGVLLERNPFTLPADIEAALKADKQVWDNFSQFPDSYKNIRIGYIHNSRIRPEEFEKRLNYFIKMTRQNKMFGSVV